MKNTQLKIGDNVMWRGAWGTQPPVETTVTGIELCSVGSKYGMPVDKVSWNKVFDRGVVVTLSNGHWAYGDQIDQIN